MCVGLLGRCGLAELARRPSLKVAIKETKNTLHQVGGAYLDGPTPYSRWLDALRAADDAEARREACRSIMAHHASTRERLPDLDALYAGVFAALPPIRSVIDIACGLNPLALPWMRLEPGATYHAYDIYTDMMDFIDSALPLLGVTGAARARDVTADPPAELADLALVLKTLPCLEQTTKDAGASLLDALNARHLVVSFPARSLGGRGKGMVSHYGGRFEALLAARGWPWERLLFDSELVYIVRKAE